MTTLAANSASSPKGAAYFAAKLKPLSVTDDDPNSACQAAAAGTLAGAASALQQFNPVKKELVRAANGLSPGKGAPKLPHVIKPTRYTLGAHALRALRLAHEDGTIPSVQGTQRKGPPSNADLTQGTYTGISLSGLSTTFPGAFSNKAGLSQTACPPPCRKPSTSSNTVLLSHRSSNGPNSPGAASMPGTLQQHTTVPATDDGAVIQENAASLDLVDPQDDVLPSLYMNDDDELTGRILSLPNILCHAANCDIFLVGLGEVQTMLHKRRLGSKGLAVLRRFEGATLAAWDVGREKAEDTYSLKWHQQHEAKVAATAKRRIANKGDDDDPTTAPLSPTRMSMSKSALAAAAAAATSEESDLAGMVGAGLSPELEAEVAAHVAASMGLVEKHRQHLVCNSDRVLAELAKQQAVEAASQRKQQAVEYVVKQLIPEKILAMANTRRTKLGAGNQLFRRMKQSISKSQHNSNKSSSPADTAVEAEIDGDAGSRSSNSRGGNGRWGKLQGVTGDALAGMPFIDDWSAAIRKLGKQDAGKGWDELLVANMVYVKGASGDGQGAAVYTYHCQQLGVIPSTQVVTQLRCAESNMSHCKLGRRGAKALRHALTTNTTITSLDLTDNSLDAQGVAEIAAGLTAGTMANMAPKARKVLQDKWKALDWVKAIKQSGVDTVLAVPENMKSALEGKDCAWPAGQDHEGTDASNSTCSSPTRGPSSPSKGGPNTALIWEVTGGVGKSTTNRLNGKAVYEMSGRKKASIPKPATAGPSPSNILSSYMSRIRNLDLSENLLGVNGAKVIANILDPSVTPSQFLTELRLNKCGIPDVGGIAIFKAIGNGNNKLALLSLSNNECGNASAAALGDTLAVNVGLHELDMSWNQIKPEGVEDICKGLDSNTALQRLDLSWNGLENQGVVRLGQMLMVNTGLKHLNLTNTRMGGEACIVLGEGIKVNKRLEDLILNGNAVGDDGARHLMSALKQNDTLQFLGLQGSNMSTAARGQSGASDFNPLAPDGSYTLQLSHPPDRAVAVQLCRMEMDSKTELMRNVKLDGRNITSVKNMKWPDVLPVQGLLTCDFATRRSQKLVQVLDHKKFQALVGQLDSASMSDKEKSALVDVMAPFTYLYCHQIAQILKCFSMGGELVRSAALLFTRAADLEERVEAMTSVMQERDIHALQQALGWYSYLRFSNPTGHYELNLTTNVHQALAGRLKDVAYGEPSDGNNWHNIVHDLYTHTTKTPSNFGPPEAWKGVIPQRGSLAFDFVSTATIPDDAQAISDDQLIDFLHHGIGVRFRDNGAPLPEADFGEADLQVTRVISCFQYSPHRVEVVVLLYARILDRKNIWTILYAMRALEQAVLHWRLGMQLFDKSHPSGHYVLDLSNPAHEQVARRLVELAANNSTDVPFFWNIRLQGNKKNMLENRNMWGTITAESFTPFLEFDFIYSDVPDCLLNKTKADWEALTKGDRLDAAARLSRRMELQRIKDMYGHFSDGSGWTPPAWASAGQLFKPLLNKPPWLAAWDRLVRLLVRYDIRSGDISGESYLEDIFDAHCSDEGELTQESFEALCKEWGYTRSELHYHYRPLFESSARPSAAASNAPDNGSTVPGEPAMTNSMSGGVHSGLDGPRRSSTAQIPGDWMSGRARTSVTTLSRLQASTYMSSADGSDRPPPPPMVLHFGTFVDVIMREPVLDVRFKEIPLVTTSLTVAAAAKALKGLRKGNAAAKK